VIIHADWHGPKQSPGAQNFHRVQPVGRLRWSVARQNMRLSGSRETNGDLRCCGGRHRSQAWAKLRNRVSFGNLPRIWAVEAFQEAVPIGLSGPMPCHSTFFSAHHENSLRWIAAISGLLDAEYRSQETGRKSVQVKFLGLHYLEASMSRGANAMTMRSRKASSSSSSANASVATISDTRSRNAGRVRQHRNTLQPEA